MQNIAQQENRKRRDLEISSKYPIRTMRELAKEYNLSIGRIKQIVDKIKMKEKYEKITNKQNRQTKDNNKCYL